MPTHDQKPIDLTGRVHRPITVSIPGTNLFLAECSACFWSSKTYLPDRWEVLKADDMRQHLDEAKARGERVEYR